MSDVTFIPLGGAEKPGSSCYYLEADGLSFIFDCGCNVSSKVTDRPVFSAVPRDKKPEAIFISHIHLDHIAGIKNLPERFRKIPIISTGVNRALLWEVLRYTMQEANLFDCDRVRSIANSIIAFPYFETQDFGKYKVTLYEAGHTPGAAMVEIETENHRILYTGDKSGERSSLCNPYFIPEGKKYDIVIDCANSYYREDNMFESAYVGMLNSAFLSKDGVLNFSAGQPIKAIELLALIGEYRDIYRPGATIHATARLGEFAAAFVSSGINAIPENCVFEELRAPDFSGNNIYLHLGNPPDSWQIECVHLDYYLHETKALELEFIDKFASKDVFMVHLSNYDGKDPDRTEEYNGKTLHFCTKGTEINL